MKNYTKPVSEVQEMCPLVIICASENPAQPSVQPILDPGDETGE